VFALALVKTGHIGHTLVYTLSAASVERITAVHLKFPAWVPENMMTLALGARETLDVVFTKIVKSLVETLVFPSLPRRRFQSCKSKYDFMIRPYCEQSAQGVTEGLRRCSQQLKWGPCRPALDE
jgi:hypothetical protein